MLRIIAVIACSILFFKLLCAAEKGEPLQIAENAFYMFTILALAIETLK